LSFVPLEPAPLLEGPEDDEAHPPTRTMPSASSATRFQISIILLLEFRHLQRMQLLYRAGAARKDGAKESRKPWEGADSLEWTHLPTPVPHHTFEVPPIVR